MTQMTIRNYETIRTTINLPAELIKRSQQYIDDGTVPSRNALIVAALENFLAELERRAIDEQFAAMADDVEYHALNEAITSEFAESDWEAFTLEATRQ